MRRVSAWCLVVVLVREKEPSTLGQHSLTVRRELRDFSTPTSAQSKHVLALAASVTLTHFLFLSRMTILPPTEKLKVVLKKIGDFHMRFNKEFS